MTDLGDAKIARAEAQRLARTLGCTLSYYRNRHAKHVDITLPEGTKMAGSSDVNTLHHECELWEDIWPGVLDELRSLDIEVFNIVVAVCGRGHMSSFTVAGFNDVAKPCLQKGCNGKVEPTFNANVGKCNVCGTDTAWSELMSTWISLAALQATLGDRIGTQIVNPALTRVTVDGKPIGALYPGDWVSTVDLAGSDLTLQDFGRVLRDADLA